MAAGEHHSMDSSPLNILAENLGRLKTVSGAPHTQAEIAEKAHVDQKTVGRTLAASNALSVDKLAGFAAAFKVKPWQLLVPNLDPSNPPTLAQVAPAADKDVASLAEVIHGFTLKQREKLLAVADFIAAHGDTVKITLSVDLPVDAPAQGGLLIGASVPTLTPRQDDRRRGGQVLTSGQAEMRRKEALGLDPWEGIHQDDRPRGGLVLTPEQHERRQNQFSGRRETDKKS